MHDAKKRGGNCQRFYAPPMNRRVADRLALTSDLHRALDDCEFVVYYQSQWYSAR